MLLNPGTFFSCHYIRSKCQDSGRHTNSNNKTQYLLLLARQICDSETDPWGGRSGLGLGYGLEIKILVENLDVIDAVLVGCALKRHCEDLQDVPSLTRDEDCTEAVESLHVSACLRKRVRNVISPGYPDVRETGGE